MTKTNIPKLCYAISLLLLIGFIVHTIVDCTRYSSTLNSAPFYIWVAANTVYFIVPAIILLIVGTVIRKRHAAK